MTAAVFPGQGSQKPGMGQSLFELSTAFRETLVAISDAVGRDVTKICFELNEEELRRTENAQLALYSCGIGAWKAMLELAGSNHFDFVAGHSIGEYTALAAAGVVSVEDGAKLVQRRGELMAASGSSRPGGMAAVLGLDKPGLEAVCRDATEGDELAVIANDNSPGQLVISGDEQAIVRAVELAKTAGAKRVVPLNVSGAFHSPLMSDAALEMGKSLSTVNFREATMPVVANVTAETVRDASQWPSLLETQLIKPVRWTESTQLLLKSGVRSFVEFGSGDVLCGLIKRISKDAEVDPPPKLFAVVDAESLRATAAEFASGVKT